MYCKSPRAYQARNYYKRNRKNKKWLTVPNVFQRPRVFRAKWLKDSDNDLLSDSLLAKQHLIIS